MCARKSLSKFKSMRIARKGLIAVQMQDLPALNVLRACSMLPVSKWFSKTRRWMPAASREKRNGGPVWEDEEKKEDARWDGL